MLTQAAAARRYSHGVIRERSAKLSPSAIGPHHSSAEADHIWYDHKVSTMPADNGLGLVDRRFQLTKVLGRGPSGVVYSATDRETDQPCAVKRLHAQFYDRDVLQKVQRDSLAAAKLNNANIVGAFQAGFESSGALYLAMPLLVGESLLARLSRGPLSLTATLALLEPLCAALQAAHEVGLHHGAITPSNIICLAAGGVALTDFGVCHLRATPKVQWGGAMGYAAPETFADKAELSSARGDVFALGALVFECLTGQRMFSATSLATFKSSVMAPPKLGTLLPAYEHLDAVLEMASTFEPADRFASAGAIWRALQSSLIEIPVSIASSLLPVGSRATPAPTAQPPKAPPPFPDMRTAKPVRAMPVLKPPPSLELGDKAAQPADSSGTSRLPAPLPPPPQGPRGAAQASQHSAIPTQPMPMIPADKPRPSGLPQPPRRKGPRDPEQLIATDSGHSLRRAPASRAEFLQPVVWAAVGGLVVGITILTLQWLTAARSAALIAAQRRNATPLGVSALDENAILQRAQNELAQRNFTTALGYAEQLLRSQPQHLAAKAIQDQASEMMRSSAVYGAFLRAVDRDAAETAAALFRELPAGSSYRAQAWEPFPNVRNQFVRRRLNLAEAALNQGNCSEIRAQVDRLHWVADSSADQALLQGQRLIGKCLGGEPPAATATVATHTPKPHPVSSELKSPFGEPGAVGDKPKKRKHKAEDAGAAGKPDSGESKPATTPPPKEDAPTLPKGLRNPFG